MGQILAALKRFLAASHCINEAAFLVEIARQDLPHQFVWVSALLSCGFRQSGFLFGREMYFHEAQSTAKLRVWQRRPIPLVANIRAQKARDLRGPFADH
jgi:hypothetical protein